MRITILNTVALNGGDEALLEATVLGLKDKLGENIEFNYLSNNPVLSNEIFDKFYFNWDWEHAANIGVNKNSYVYRGKRKVIRLLKKYLKIKNYYIFPFLFLSKEEKKTYKILKKTNFFVLAPGGYIHDFYGYEARANTCNFIKNILSKDYFIFSQSIGPFFKDQDRSKLIDFLQDAKAIVLREKYSKNHVEGVIKNLKNSIVSTDVAFYLRKKYEYKPKKEASNEIVMCFRKWDNEKVNQSNLIKAIELSKRLITQNYKLTFISTCQGIKGYVDDSEFAREIVEGLSVIEQNKCTIITHKLMLDNLVEFLSKFDCYIGMRLHGAILSMLAGLPALNIAYEDKTLGIYDDMELTDYRFKYEESIDVWFNKVDFFIKRKDQLKFKLPAILDIMYIKSERNFEVFNEYLP